MADNRFRRNLQTGERVFQEGEPGTCAYVIESGRIEITKANGAAAKPIATLGAGDIFGEMALIDDQARSASAVAAEPSTLMVITREYLDDRLQESDPLLRHVLRVVSQRLRTAMFAPGATAGAGGGAAPPLGEADRRIALDRLQLVQAMQQGLDRGEFELHLQPIVRLDSRRTAGFEALIRWNRPGHGFVSPAQFIPVAEQSDLIVRIGRWTVETACAHLAKLEQSGASEGLPPLFVGVNLSGGQFGDEELFPVVLKALDRHRIAPGRLKFEVTETLLIHNFDAAAMVLRRCKELGLKLALDDFGTGYSSLSYLNRFPVDMLKIDRAFVKEVLASSSTQKIVKAVASLGRDLGMEVLAEGIEALEEADMLGRLGVEFGQGWAYAKAMPLPKAIDYVRANAAPRLESRAQAH